MHDFSELFQYLGKIFKNLDYFIFTEEELNKQVAFYTREYVLEYLSKGIPLYGVNPFVDIYKKVSLVEYKRSIFIRTVAHIQLVRKVYTSSRNSFDYKLSYIKKYILRIGKNVLLFSELSDYDTLDNVSPEQLLKELHKHGFLDNYQINDFNALRPLDFFYNVFCDLSEKVLLLKSDKVFTVSE